MPTTKAARIVPTGAKGVAGLGPPVAKADRAAKADRGRVDRERAANRVVTAAGRVDRINAVAAGRLPAAPVVVAVRSATGMTGVRAGRNAGNNRVRCPS